MHIYCATKLRKSIASRKCNAKNSYKRYAIGHKSFSGGASFFSVHSPCGQREIRRRTNRLPVPNFTNGLRPLCAEFHYFSSGQTKASRPQKRAAYRLMGHKKRVSKTKFNDRGVRKTAHYETALSAHSMFFPPSLRAAKTHTAHRACKIDSRRGVFPSSYLRGKMKTRAPEK